MHTSQAPSKLYNITHLNFRSIARAAQTRKHGLGHNTIIIIAVAASVGGAVVVLVLWRVLSRSSRRRNAAPLPPVQPLAHHREHQLAAFEEHKIASSRPQTWFDDQAFPPYRHDSNASLLPRPRDSSGPSREPSFRTQETAHTFTAEEPARPLPLPNPSYIVPSPQPSSSSTSLSSAAEHGGPSPPTPATPFSASASSSSSIHPRSRSASRPFSMLSTSTTNTGTTTRSRTPIRGAPHAPHSNVQIVLPAPLAPELYPHMVTEDARGRRIFSGVDSAQRASWGGGITDRWVPVGYGASEPPPVPQVRRQASRESQRSSREYRSSTSSRSQHRSSSNPPPASRLRTSSTPSFGPDRRDPDRPPVPRIPSAYFVAPEKEKSLPIPPPAQSPPSAFPGAMTQEYPSSARRLQKPRSSSAVGRRRNSAEIAL
ncbi:hypothetical protein BV25DRAFT_1987540 [Artomyces pyxidatus]|uniref:Uncharacterized protein n=1 Tax=Artomyces pyxidatus TaxID=48021 RepID=A0ACB8THH3_9AGAM|nr:hypothetical protein BV25DRAFT_1987540 [Artomyces pyxidatus]